MFFNPSTSKTVFVSAIFLFSFFSAFGGNTADVDRLGRTRNLQSPQGTQLPAPNRAPFENTVIILYKGPANTARTSATSKPAATATGRTATSSPLIGEAAGKISDSGKNGPVQVNTANVFRPVIIEYRTYGPADIANVRDLLPVDPPHLNTGVPVAMLSASTLSKPLGDTMLDPATIGHADLAQDPDRTGEREDAKDDEPEPRQRGTADVPHIPGGNAPADPVTIAASEKDPGVSVDSRPKTDNEELASDNINTATKKAAVSQPDGAAENGSVSSEPSTGETGAKPSEPSDKAPVLETAPDAKNAPTGVIGMNNEAVRLTVEGRYDEAEALLDQAIALEPAEARFHRNLSVLYEMSKRYDEALASARTAGKLAPESVSVFEQLCPLELTKGDAVLALDCYERFRKVKPLDAPSKAYYGVALYRNGKEDEALEVLEKAVGAVNPPAEALNAIGVVYFKKKRVDDAVAALKSAVEMAPDEPGYRYNLALAQFADGNKASAVSQYKFLKTDRPELARRLYKLLYGDKLVFVEDLQSQKP